MAGNKTEFGMLVPQNKREIDRDLLRSGRDTGRRGRCRQRTQRIVKLRGRRCKFSHGAVDEMAAFRRAERAGRALPHVDLAP